MHEDTILARLASLTHLFNELKALLDSINQRLAAAEQSLGQRWDSAGTTL